MIIEGGVIVVQDRDTNDVIEVFSRMRDYQNWLSDTGTDPDRVFAEFYTVNFSLNVEINQ